MYSLIRPLLSKTTKVRAVCVALSDIILASSKPVSTTFSEPTASSTLSRSKTMMLTDRPAANQTTTAATSSSSGDQQNQAQQPMLSLANTPANPPTNNSGVVAPAASSQNNGPPSAIEKRAKDILSTPHAVPDVEVFTAGDDVLISGKLGLAGENLQGNRAKVMQWDASAEVWAIRLGSTGQIVGAKAEKLRKVYQVTQSDLRDGEWTRVPQQGLEAQILNFPNGVEVKMDLSSGGKLVRMKPSKTDGEL